VLSPTDLTGHTFSEYTKLGSPDVLMIGIFMATVYRFSMIRQTMSYIIVNQLAFIIGIMGTFVIARWRMKITPAMILPSICCTIGTFSLATYRHEVHVLWNFEDAWWYLI
jgi:hypothetical protein